MNTDNQSYEYVISRMVYDYEFQGRNALPNFERYCGLFNPTREDFMKVVENYLSLSFLTAQNKLTYGLPYQVLSKFRHNANFGMIVDWMIEEREAAEEEENERMERIIARQKAINAEAEAEAEKAKEVLNGD